MNPSLPPSSTHTPSHPHSHTSTLTFTLPHIHTVTLSHSHTLSPVHTIILHTHTHTHRFQAPSTFRAVVLVLAALLVAFPLGLLRNVDSLSTISVMSLIFYCLLAVEVIYLSTGSLKGTAVWNSHLVLWNNSGVLKCLPIISLAFACHTYVYVA